MESMGIDKPIESSLVVHWSSQIILWCYMDSVRYPAGIHKRAIGDNCDCACISNIHAREAIKEMMKMSLITQIQMQVKHKQELEFQKEMERQHIINEQHNREWEAIRQRDREQHRIEKERAIEEARQEALHPSHKPGYDLEKAYNDFLDDMLEMGRIKSFEWPSTEQKEIPYDFKVTTNKGNTLYLDTVGHQITLYGRKRLHTSHKHLDDTLRDIKKNNRASRFYLVFDDGNEFMYLPVTPGMPTANIVLSRARYKSCRRSEFVFRT